MKKRNLTPEQQAARDAKRARFQKLLKDVAAMPDTERAKLAGQCGAVVTCEGRALSPINSILCFLQCPAVSVVGGFRQWLKAGRCVKKGEHGFTIWIPLGQRSGDSAGDASGAGENEGEGSQRFGTGTVFDIGQTCEVGSEETAQELRPDCQPPEQQPAHTEAAA